MSTMYGRHEIHTLRKVTDEKNERRGKKSYKRCLQKTDRLQKKGISSRYYHGIFRRECIQSRAGDGMGGESVWQKVLKKPTAGSDAWIITRHGEEKKRRHYPRYQRRHNIHCRTSDSGGYCHEKLSKRPWLMRTDTMVRIFPRKTLWSICWTAWDTTWNESWNPNLRRR